MNKNTGDGEKRRMVERMIIENRNSLNDPTTNEPYDVKGIANDVVELIQSQQQQLLQGLMEQKKEFESRIDDVPVYLHAVPVSVIQNKLEGIS